MSMPPQTVVFRTHRIAVGNHVYPARGSSCVPKASAGKSAPRARITVMGCAWISVTILTIVDIATTTVATGWSARRAFAGWATASCIAMVSGSIPKRIPRTVAAVENRVAPARYVCFPIVMMVREAPSVTGWRRIRAVTRRIVASAV